MRTSDNSSNRMAFSLVELSIVLVILGLLVGGVLSGQSLIRASELRSVSVEQKNYATAVGTFRDKYFGLPGDLNNAASLWTGVSNGDGDGLIEGTAVAATNETQMFWQHLALAQMVEGSFTPASWITSTPGTTNPSAKLEPGGWHVYNFGTVAVTSAMFYEGEYGNSLAIFHQNSTLQSFVVTGNVFGTMRSEEAWNIDTKMDDGKPHLGSVLAPEFLGSIVAGSRCGNAAVSMVATTVTDYDVTSTSNTQCALIFKLGF